MEQTRNGLTADEAIDRALEMFDRFVQRDKVLKNVLLEELEPSDDGWIVSIGFDGERKEVVAPSVNAAIFGNTRTTTVREVRHFHLDAEGNLKRMS